MDLSCYINHSHSTLTRPLPGGTWVLTTIQAEDTGLWKAGVFWQWGMYLVEQQGSPTSMDDEERLETDPASRVKYLGLYEGEVLLDFGPEVKPEELTKRAIKKAADKGCVGYVMTVERERHEGAPRALGNARGSRDKKLNRGRHG